MKAKIFLTSMLLLLFVGLSISTNAAAKQERKVEPFSKIDVGSAFKVFITQGTEQSVVVEVDDKYINNVKTSVGNGTLYINLINDHSSKRMNIKVMNVYVTMPNIDNIRASAAAHIHFETPIKSEGTVEFDIDGASQIKDLNLSCDKFKIEQSGASKCSVNLAATDVEVEISGAAKLMLSGKVEELAVDGSGVAKVDILNLKYNNSNVDISAMATLLD